MQNNEGKAERLLAENTKSKEKLLTKRRNLIQKKDEYSRKIRDLGSLPSNVDKYSSKSIEQLMSSLEKCNSKLKKYSHVNKKALDQFNSFTEQRESLLERKVELDQGRKSIEDLIKHLDQKKDEAIRRTFKGIAKQFSTVFAELVPGGKGTLVIHTKQVSW